MNSKKFKMLLKALCWTVIYVNLVLSLTGSKDVVKANPTIYTAYIIILSLAGIGAIHFSIRDYKMKKNNKE